MPRSCPAAAQVPTASELGACEVDLEQLRAHHLVIGDVERDLVVHALDEHGQRLPIAYRRRRRFPGQAPTRARRPGARRGAAAPPRAPPARGRLPAHADPHWRSHR